MKELPSAEVTAYFHELNPNIRKAETNAYAKQGKIFIRVGFNRDTLRLIYVWARILRRKR